MYWSQKEIESPNTLDYNLFCAVTCINKKEDPILTNNKYSKTKNLEGITIEKLENF